jgi:hypothetical protein
MTAATTKPSTSAWIKYLLIICMLVACVLKFINVFNAPLHYDTNLYLNVAVGYFDHGTLTPYMWRLDPAWNLVGGGGTVYGILLLVFWTRLFGLSVTSAHLLSFLVGLVNIPLIFLLARRWFQRESAGWWAVGFFVLSGTFAQTFYGRQEALSNLTCTLLLLLHLEAVKRQSHTWYWLNGIAFAVALEIHVLVVFYAGGIGLFYLTEYMRRVVATKRIVYSLELSWGVGVVIAALIYFVVHIAPNPSIYLEIPRHCLICTPPSVNKEIWRWLFYIRDQFPPLMLLFGIGLISAIVRRTRNDQHYLLVLVGAIVTMWVLNPPANTFYTGQLLPLFALGVGGLYAQGLTRTGSGLRGLAIAGVLILASTTVGRVFMTSFTPANTYNGMPLLEFPHNSMMPQEEYKAAIDFVNANIPMDTVILAPEPFFIDLINYRRFMSYYGGDLHGVWIRNETLRDLWRREHPQVFIGDPKPDAELWRYMDEGSAFVEVKPHVWVDRTLVVGFSTVAQQHMLNVRSQ